MTKHDNPLANWLRLALPEERERIAKLAGTSDLYLYQIASGLREPRVGLAKRIADASVEMYEESGGRLPALSMEELASIRALSGL